MLYYTTDKWIFSKLLGSNYHYLPFSTRNHPDSITNSRFVALLAAHDKHDPVKGRVSRNICMHNAAEEFYLAHHAHFHVFVRLHN